MPFNLNDLTTSFGSQALTNANNQLVEDEINDNLLKRNNPRGDANQMEIDLDMNGNAVTNVTSLSTASLTLNGVVYTGFTGEKGDKGDTGDIGPEGPEGPQGEPGRGGTWNLATTYYSGDVVWDDTESIVYRANQTVASGGVQPSVNAAWDTVALPSAVDAQPTSFVRNGDFTMNTALYDGTYETEMRGWSTGATTTCTLSALQGDTPAGVRGYVATLSGTASDTLCQIYDGSDANGRTLQVQFVRQTTGGSAPTASVRTAAGQIATTTCAVAALGATGWEVCTGTLENITVGPQTNELDNYFCLLITPGPNHTSTKIGGIQAGWGDGSLTLQWPTFEQEERNLQYYDYEKDINIYSPAIATSTRVYNTAEAVRIRNIGQVREAVGREGNSGSIDSLALRLSDLTTHPLSYLSSIVSFSNNPEGHYVFKHIKRSSPPNSVLTVL